jgi:NitT/TauT family transport system permease protein
MITIGVLGLLCSKAIDLCSKFAMPWLGLAAGAGK